MTIDARNRRATRRRGWTLIEMMVAMGILALLSSIVLFSAKAIRDSRRGAQAKQQLAQIAAAVNQYAAFWPAWKMVNASNVLVTVADRGWPDFIPGRLFSVGPFASVAGYNDSPGGLTFDLTDAAKVLNASTCLAYALTAASGKGPFVTDAQGINLQTLDKLDPTTTGALYPSIGGGAKPRAVFLDPWGVPVRCFWVYRDSTAYRGFLPVITADMADANFHPAEGFVLESAGPNGKFGNVWKVNPTQQEISDAADNVTVSP